MHPELVNGQSYTYEHFAKVAGVGYKCLYSRLYGRSLRYRHGLETIAITQHA